MNKEEQIALELTKLCEPNSSTTVWTNYKWFLDTLKEEKKEAIETKYADIQRDKERYKSALFELNLLIKEVEVMRNFVSIEELKTILERYEII